MTERSLPTVLRWAARWRAAARIARRDAGRHRGRTALVAALVALPLIAGSAGLVLLRSTEPSDAAIVRDALGSTVQARITMECEGAPYQPWPQGGGSCTYEDGASTPWPAGQIDRALAAVLPAGSTVLPLRSAGVDYIDGPRSQVSRSYAEIDRAEDTLWSLIALETGRAPHDPAEIVVSGHMARSARLEVGDTVGLRPAMHGAVPTVPPVTFTVVGTSRVGAGIPVDFVALPGSSLAAFDDTMTPTTWYVTGDAPVRSDHAQLLHPHGLAVLTRDAVVTPRPSYTTSDPIMSVAQKIPGRFGSMSSAVLAVVVLVVLLEAILLIGPAFVVGARRETRNLALVAATGGEPADLRRIVLATGLVVGGGAAVVGTLLGAGLGVALVPALRTQDIYVPDVALPVGELCTIILGGTALALAAAWLPARRAARTDVVAALSGRRPVTTVRRRRPLVGLVSLGIGLLAALTGALTAQGTFLLVGVLALEIGVIGTAGSVVGRLARSAHRAGPAVRYALRDADRHRARTAPALAAIIAATAVAGAGLTYQASDAAANTSYSPPPAAVGTRLVTLSPGMPAGEKESIPPTWGKSVATYRVALREALGDVELVDVKAAAPSATVRSAEIDLLQPADHTCPADRAASDPRCSSYQGSYNRFGVGSGEPALVDDGATVRALDLPHAERIAHALADDHVIVATEHDLWTEADGSTTAHLAVPGRDLPVVVPAVAHSWGPLSYSLILPPSVVAEIGWTSTLVGLVVPAGDGDPARTAIRDVPGLNAWDEVVTERGSASSGIVLAVITAAALLSVLATWTVVGLAAAESRPDLATLSAIGASPRTRRALAGAQAGVLAAVGTSLGVLTGVLFGAVLVLAERVGAGVHGWAWHLTLPWPFLALLACTAPVLSVGGAALMTRSTLPVTRRLAS